MKKILFPILAWPLFVFSQEDEAIKFLLFEAQQSYTARSKQPEKIFPYSSLVVNIRRTWGLYTAVNLKTDQKICFSIGPSHAYYGEKITQEFAFGPGIEFPQVFKESQPYTLFFVRGHYLLETHPDMLLAHGKVLFFAQGHYFPTGYGWWHSASAVWTPWKFIGIGLFSQTGLRPAMRAQINVPLGTNVGLLSPWIGKGLDKRLTLGASASFRW